VVGVRRPRFVGTGAISLMQFFTFLLLFFVFVSLFYFSLLLLLLLIFFLLLMGFLCGRWCCDRWRWCCDRRCRHRKDGVARAVVGCRMSGGSCAGCDMMVGIVEGVGAMVGRGGESSGG